MSNIFDDNFSGTASTALESHVPTPGPGTQWSLPVGSSYMLLDGSNHVYCNANNSHPYASNGYTLPTTQVWSWTQTFDVVTSTTYTQTLRLLDSTLAANAGYQIFQFSGSWYFRNASTSGDVASPVSSPAFGVGNHTFVLTYNPSTQTFTSITLDGNTLWSNVTDSAYVPYVIGFANDFGSTSVSSGTIFGESIVAPVIPPLAAGATFAFPKTNTSVRATCAPATGGTPAPTGYLYQFQESVNGGAYANVGPNSTQSWIERTGLSSSNTYTYRSIASDLIPTSVTGSASSAISPATQTITGDVEYILFGTTSTIVSDSSGSGGNVPAHAFDGDFSTWYTSPNANAYIGMYFGSGNLGVLNFFRYTPDSGEILAWPAQVDLALQGALIRGSTTNTAPWTTLATISATDFPLTFPSAAYNNPASPVTTGLPPNNPPIVPAGAWAAISLYTPSNFCRCADIMIGGWFISGTPCQPIVPDFSLLSGMYVNGTSLVISSATLDAQIAYTNDGTNPAVTWSGSTPIPSGTTTIISNGGSVLLPSNAFTNIRAIAIHPSATVQSSRVRAASYQCPAKIVTDTGTTNNYGTTNHWPQDWFGTDGLEIRVDFGTIIYERPYFYFVGQNFNTARNNTTGDTWSRGYPIYQSSDLYNWTPFALIPPSPTTGNYGAAATGSANGLNGNYTPNILINPSPIDHNKRLACYSQLADPPGYANTYLGVATAPDWGGPWTWAPAPLRAATGSHIPSDGIAFIDSDGTHYHIYHDFTDSGIIASKLDPSTDYTTYTSDASIMLWPDSTREAPAIFYIPGSPNTYFLMTSHGTPYGGTATAVTYESGTGTSLANAAANLVASTPVTPFASTPAVGSVPYNVQPMGVFRWPTGSNYFVFVADFGDAGEVPVNLYHARMAVWPITPSMVSGTTLAITAPASWDTSILPPLVSTFPPGIQSGGRMGLTGMMSGGSLK